MTTQVTWNGDAYIALIRSRVVAILQECGFAIVPMVQAVTPVRTGAARASVTFEVQEEAQRVVLRYGGTVSYFIWIEIGSRGRAGAAPLARTFQQAVTLVRERLAGIV